MIIRKEIDLTKPLSNEQKEMLAKLDERPVQIDEECPEITAEQFAKMRKISEIRRGERRKQTVTLRLSPKAFNTAKSLGKGYTAVLSRILESALTDMDVVKNYL